MEFRKLKNIFFALAAAICLIFGSAGVSSASPILPTNTRVWPSSPIATPTAALWMPYDYSQITSAGSCSARLSWLRTNVHWVKTSNSMCQKFMRNQCPTSYYWMVMLKDQSAGMSGGKPTLEASRAPTVAVCG